MTLALRRGGPDDYDVIHDGETVGRIYRIKATESFGDGRSVGATARPKRRVICHPRRGDGGRFRAHARTER
jgi:hypothetical protein